MRQENGRLAHVFARPRSRVGRHFGTGDCAGSDVPEPAGRGLLGMGDDLAASQGRRAAHAPAAGSGSGRSSASGVRLDSPARPARGRGPDARSPLSPLVPTRPPPQPPSQPPSQQTQQHARPPPPRAAGCLLIRRGCAPGARFRQRRGERRRGRRAIAPAGGGEEEAEDGEAAGRDAAEQGLYPLLLRGHGPGGQARALLHAPARPSGARHAICRGRLAAAQRLRRRALPLRGRRLVRHSLAGKPECVPVACPRGMRAAMRAAA